MTTPSGLTLDDLSTAIASALIDQEMDTSPAVGDDSVDGTDSANETIYLRWEIVEGHTAYIVPIIFAVVFVVGLVGNGTLILSVLANKVMHNVPNILIVSLSLGDFLLILVSVPMNATYFTFTSWPYGDVACRANEAIQTLSLGVSIFTLCALSADRYVAIVDPMAKLTGRTKRTTVAIAVGIWLFSALCAVPDAVMSTVLVYRNASSGVMYTFCNICPLEYELYPNYYTAMRLVGFFILPVLIIGFFYTMMARMLVRSNDLVAAELKSSNGNHQRQMDARRKVARVVLSFVIIFIFCWLPRHIYLMWFNFSPDDSEFNEFWVSFKVIGFVLTFINSCVNPFALYFISGQFRKYYNRYLFCMCRRRHYTPVDNTSAMQMNTTRRASNTRTSMVNSHC